MWFMNVNEWTSCEVLLDKRSHLERKEVEMRIFLAFYNQEKFFSHSI